MTELSADLPASLVLAGAGKMGGAMLEGWLAAGLPPPRLTVVDPCPTEALSRLASSHGFALNPPGGAAPEVFVLGIKPQGLRDAAPGLRWAAGPDTALVSILAGKTVADLKAAFPEVGAVVRTIPNLPASIGRGATGAFAERAVTARQRAVASGLLSAVGIVEWVADEGLIDAVTAVSGSGPAYVFHLVEALAEAGRAAGLEAGLAGRLARATVVGAGELLDRSDLPAGTLRENVTSPGGTTAAAFAILMGEGGMTRLLEQAVAAAKRRAAELSG